MEKNSFASPNDYEAADMADPAELKQFETFQHWMPFKKLVGIQKQQQAVARTDSNQTVSALKPMSSDSNVCSSMLQVKSSQKMFSVPKEDQENIAPRHNQAIEMSSTCKNDDKNAAIKLKKIESRNAKVEDQKSGAKAEDAKFRASATPFTPKSHDRL